MIKAYIGLGSNLGDSKQHVLEARAQITALHGISEDAFSGLFQSRPMGPQDQPDYVNAVLAIITDLSALTLLRELQNIEQEHGRLRTGERWGARTLDLDILLYGDERIDIPDLQVPHIGIAERDFVLYPLKKIAPLLIIPGHGSVQQLCEQFPDEQIIEI